MDPTASACTISVWSRGKNEQCCREVIGHYNFHFVDNSVVNLITVIGHYNLHFVDNSVVNLITAYF